MLVFVCVGRVARVVRIKKIESNKNVVNVNIVGEQEDAWNSADQAFLGCSIWRKENMGSAKGGGDVKPTKGGGGEDG